MPAALIAQLIATLGPSAIALITTLISKWETNTPVTAAEWTALSAQLQLTAAAHMTTQLQAAGISPTSPQGQALLKLTIAPSATP